MQNRSFCGWCFAFLIIVFFFLSLLVVLICYKKKNKCNFYRSSYTNYLFNQTMFLFVIFFFLELKIQLLPTGQKHGIAWHVAYQLVVLILTDIILLTFVDFLFVCLVISKNFNLSVVIVYLIGQFTLYYNNRVRDNFTFYFLSHQKVVSVGFSSPIPFTSTKIYLIIF